MTGEADLFDFAADLKHETDRAYLVNDGKKDHWLPKQFTENNGDRTFTIPEWLAIEGGLHDAALLQRPDGKRVGHRNGVCVAHTAHPSSPGKGR